MSEAAHDVIEAQCGPVMPLLSKMLRGMFVAAPGCALHGGDFSNIEGRINAWMAGEEWKLQAFRDYDAGVGPDLYKVAYMKAFGVGIDDVKFVERDIGKKAELSAGYQGSVGAWLRFSPDTTVVTRVIREKFEGTEQWRKAAEQHARAQFHNGLAPDNWTSVKLIINSWRESNGRIVQSWWDRQDAAIEAVECPGTKVAVCGGRVAYLVTDGFLWTRLPSGKLLAYAQPRLVDKRDDWLIDEEGNAHPAGEMEADEIELRVAAGWTLQEGRRRVQVAYSGKNQKTGQWGRQHLYGGSQCNNDVQGTARELLRFAMGNVERAGYPLVMHVHDELVSEVATEFGSAAHYQELMSILPPWLAGLPLAAKAWTDRRYVK